ncbi:hypothetical protein V6N12_062816 [Hibiscus sabdariffa]|uniref:Uncharacterized protein n=1 Tax=Hibiscus sabdariffa TaxID=183260 RepID=A0ABR2F9Y6_9ROSI
MQRGLKVRKSTGSKPGDRIVLAEWVTSFASQILNPPRGVHVGGDGDARNDQIHAMVYSLNDGDSHYDSQWEDIGM